MCTLRFHQQLKCNSNSVSAPLRQAIRDAQSRMKEVERRRIEEKEGQDERGGRRDGTKEHEDRRVDGEKRRENMKRTGMVAGKREMK